jgi:aspartyl-tRNA(Asn)/glutamyl-tRNA(Gln) amidotransferase subunit B
VSERRPASERRYEPVIGLEIHVQLKTRTKMFCGCELSFGEEPNTRTCAVCLGLPGALPVANAQAVHLGLMIGMALGSELAPRSIFHRKNYFYPDLPKGYQISQYDEPLCRGGRLGDVRIHRVHLEEDAAKLIHVGASGRIHGSQESVVDFNRGGTPLAEIVTEQASEWLKLLRTTLRQLGVSDVNMEEGSLRCDANISLRAAGTQALGTKTELKNMNSFRFIERGIRAEIARQQQLLESGAEVVQETLHFDPVSERITSLRSKEEAHDYRYFPEPDLLPVAIDEQMLSRAREALGELPAERAQRYELELSLSAESARLLAFRNELGDYFETALAQEVDPAPAPQALANWLTSEMGGRLEEGQDPADSRVEPAALAALVGLVSAKRISVGAGRQVLDRLLAEGGDPATIVAAENLAALDGDDELTTLVAAALAANPDAAARVRDGNAKAIGPIVGYVMRESKGRADGGEVTRLVHEQLGV